MQMLGILYQVLMQIITQMLAILTMPVFWIVAVLLAVQVGAVQIKSRKQAARLPAFLFVIIVRWLQIIISGIAGGVIASSLFLLTGVSMGYTTALYLWITMLLLFIINRRFFCFAYAGGILVLVQIISTVWHISWLNFDGAALLILIAILHFTEAVLVRISGAVQQIPVYFRNRQGILTTKTQLQMCWPVPLALPVPVMPSSIVEFCNGYFMMPEWWPLFGSAESIETAVIYQLMPMLAMIGYSNMAESGKEKRQIRKSSLLLIVYSVILCILVWLGRMEQQILVIAALFAILGHESIVWLGRIDMRQYVHIKKE